MTDIVERLREHDDTIAKYVKACSDLSQQGIAEWNRAEKAAAKYKELREALREIYEVYAGSEGIPQPMTAAEGYLLSLLMEVVRIAQKALKEKE